MFKESITPKELEKIDFASCPGKIVVIDSVGAEFNRAIAYLRNQKVIGFDTETRPTFSPDQPRYSVSLLQLSGPDKSFLFRINFNNLIIKCSLALKIPCNATNIVHEN